MFVYSKYNKEIALNSTSHAKQDRMYFNQVVKKTHHIYGPNLNIKIIHFSLIFYYIYMGPI